MRCSRLVRRRSAVNVGEPQKEFDFMKGGEDFRELRDLIRNRINSQEAYFINKRFFSLFFLIT